MLDGWDVSYLTVEPEITPDQVRDRSRILAGLRQVTALAPGDPGHSVRLHQARDHTPTNLDALALQLAGDTLRPVRRIRRMDLYDAYAELLLVLRSLSPAGLGTDPSVEATPIRDQDPAQTFHAEPAAQPIDQRETLPRRSTVDERLSRLTQNLVLKSENPGSRADGDEPRYSTAL